MYAVAAGIAYLIRSAHPAPAAVVTAPVIPANVQPGGNKATLALADRQFIDLDSGADGVLTSQDNIMVAKQDGRLAYNDEHAERATLIDGSIRYVHGSSNTLLNPEDQSAFAANVKLKTLHHINVDEITA